MRAARPRAWLAAAAFVVAARVPVLPARGYFDGAPDLVVEVTSASDRYGEVHDKALEWIGAGARIVWVVDPMVRCVTIHRRNGEPCVAHGDDLLEGGDVLPGFGVRVSELFPG